MNQSTATALTLSIRQIRQAMDGIEAIAITLHEIGLARDIGLNEDGEEMLNRLSTQRVTSGFASALSVLAAHAQENAYSRLHAVVVQTDAEAPQAIKKDSKLEVHRKVLESAWWATGAEERAGLPYVSRSAMKDKLAADGRKARTIENDLSPAYAGRLIGVLLLSEIIQPFEHGWVVSNEVQASAMLMRKRGGKGIDSAHPSPLPS